VKPWTEQLSQVQAALRRDASLRAALYDPALPVQKKLDRLGQAVPRSLDSEVRKFLGTLIVASHIDELDEILAEFERLVERRPEETRAHIVTAVPLTSEEEQALRSRLSARFGADLDFSFEVDESVIGGVYVRVGDQVIDGTVASKLTSLRDRLAA
jgi:F-type H+-transporting ATPase subunit delta